MKKILFISLLCISAFISQAQLVLKINRFLVDSAVGGVSKLWLDTSYNPTGQGHWKDIGNGSGGGSGGSGTVSSGAINRLAYYQAAGTTVSNLAAITGNRALISNSNGLPTHSAVTDLQLSYVGNVTSDIQAQINLKAPLASPTFTGTVVIPNGSNLGTPTTLIGTNITGTASGFTAGTVTTNANLTGDVTSVGNATSIASGVIVNADISGSAAIDVSKLALSLTTTGSSGAATLIGNILNIPQYSGGGITGTGSNGRLALWDGTGSQTYSDELQYAILSGSVSLGVGGAPNRDDPSGDSAHIFQIVNDNTTKQMFAMRAYGAGGLVYENNMHVYRADGTQASPTNTKDGMYFFSLGTRGFDTDWTQSSGALQFQATEDFDGSGHGTKAIIQLTPNNSITRSTVMEILGDGQLNLSTTKYGTSGVAKMLTVNNGVVDFDDIPSGGGSWTDITNGVDLVRNNIEWGADDAVDSRTNNTNKTARMLIASYANAEEPFAAMIGVSGSSDNALFWGGASSLYNGATYQSFYTTSSPTTLTGTEKMRISDGVYINTGSDQYKLPTTRPASNGYVLAGNTDGTTSWAAGGGSSQWANETGGISYSDKVLVGSTGAASAAFHVKKSTVADVWVQGGSANGDYAQIIFSNGTPATGTYAEFVRFSNASSSNAGDFIINNLTKRIVFSTSYSSGYREDLAISSAGAIKFGTYGAGTLVTDAGGNITASSDESLKNIKGEYKAGLLEVMGVNPILYSWNEKSGLETKGTYAGFSAQNVKANIPFGTGQNTDGTLTLQDRAVLAAAINAIKELNIKVEKLEKQLKEK